MSLPTRNYRNRILAGLPKAEIGRLAPHLTPIDLKVGTHLLDGQADYAYFMEQGIASVVLTLADGATVEVGVIGFDGVVGLPMLLGSTSMPGATFIQVEGSGFRIDARRLKSEFERTGQLRDRLQRYMLASLIQSAQNGACNRLHTIVERLARWLLTCHDRVQSERIGLTARISRPDAGCSPNDGHPGGRNVTSSRHHRLFTRPCDDQEPQRSGERRLRML